MSLKTAVILAGGHGSRMKSNLMKVLHPVAGKPMVGHVVDNAKAAGLDQIVAVIGYQRERVQEYLGARVEYAVQEQQLGTGHAVLQAEPYLHGDEGFVLVLYGDNPFLGPETINRLIDRHERTGAAATLLSAIVKDPTGLGRIFRNAETGLLERVIEEKDATPEQKKITEIWPGVVVFRRKGLVDLLKRVDNNNAQKEYYLPRAVELLVEAGERVEVACEASEVEAIAPNNRVQLAEAETWFRRRINEKHMLNGVTIIDPHSTYIDEEVQIGRDTVIWPFTFIHGKAVIGEECTIGPSATIRSSNIADRCKVESSVVEESQVGPDCQIGPMAHLRPGCELEAEVEVGNYAELKKAKVGRGVKCHHHSYLGDVTIGERANIGAGAITSNYNGIEKHRTEIGPMAFIGTNVNLVAPVSIGDDALVAAGSTVTKSVPAGALSVERAEQVVKEGYVAKLKARWKARKENREGV
ncbi:MAG TPA: bifunctional UDP-N-acetylglucosamine diphosphorylase/glucosamine-1-phosphate N-acetyltransferase GlmU [Symbiobacteriaceae bacterium]|nr:bifunctional UDP-N-acetylglucosamine diphosphorylase/glucosamine-1-phosphate N-acetyltransferase GlmU [Symbiobacteriaceae bacterium]